MNLPLTQLYGYRRSKGEQPPFLSVLWYSRGEHLMLSLSMELRPYLVLWLPWVYLPSTDDLPFLHYGISLTSSAATTTRGVSATFIASN